MSRFHPLTHLRNVGIIAHVDAGKTTLSERILYLGGRIHRTGEVHHGDTTLDHLPQERAKGITITAAATSMTWAPSRGLAEGGTYRVDLIDTPGHVDFTIEVERALRVLDGAVVVLDGSRGVEPQSESVWRQADRYGVPRLVFVNKMDKVGANFGASLGSLRDRLGAPAVPIQWPIGQGAALAGVIDLLTMEALSFEPADGGRTARVSPIPEPDLAAAQAARERLVERLAEEDEEVLGSWMNHGAAQVDPALLGAALRRATLQRRLIPVLLGSAQGSVGVSTLLDAVAAYLPSPLDRGAVQATDPRDGQVLEVAMDPAGPTLALAFKVTSDPWMGNLTWIRLYAGRLAKGDALLHTVRGRTVRVGRLLRLHAARGEEITAAQAGEIVAIQGLKEVRTGDTLADPERPWVLGSLVVPEPVAEVTLVAASTREQERLATAVAKMVAEDPSLSVGTDPESGAILLRGMGELHLEVTADRLRTEHGVEARLGRPSVAYRQTVLRPAEVTERLKVQNGGPGMFAQVSLRILPGPVGGGEAFRDLTRGGVIPKSLLPWVEKGARGALSQGAWPVVDVIIELLDGQVHERDSTGPAFERAASRAVRRAVAEAGTRLLEPWMRVELTTPREQLGEVLADLAARTAEIRGTTVTDVEVQVEAEAPLSGLFGYGSALRGCTHGRGQVRMQFARYAPARTAGRGQAKAS